MSTERLGDNLKISEELIKKSCLLSLQAQISPHELFYATTGESDAVFSFPGSWSVDNWYSGERAFGETQINLALFPSMRSVGNIEEVATVNAAFLHKFEHVLQNSQLRNKVHEAVNENKRIVFTGHSSGGAIAVLATIWFLENYPQAADSRTFFCVTFGSPLVGNHIFCHALRREKWSQYFIHFVMRYDIVPRILLAPAPLSSLEIEQFEKILRFFNPKSPDSLVTPSEALHFYTSVMRNASTVTTHVASKLMGSTNLVLETVASFIKLSPYKVFGTYIFCTGNGKLVVLKNPDAVLQILFYSCQLGSETDGAATACRCLNEHLGYGNELLGTEGSLDMQDVAYIDRLKEIPLASDGVLDDLGLSAKGRLCLRAAGELEEQRLRNEKRIDEKMPEIEKEMKGLQDYQALCAQSVGYYDAFKVQEHKTDFEANISRLVLAGIWDEISEMLKRYELPDEFESRKEWIERGTKFRRLVEPLDISNYYRHAKNEDTGPYLGTGRPRRYKFTQRWLEHRHKLRIGSCRESCFLAEVEELTYVNTSDPAEAEKIKDRVLELQREVGQWIRRGEVGRDVLLKDSTFVKWRASLPVNLKEGSIEELIKEEESRRSSNGST